MLHQLEHFLQDKSDLRMDDTRFLWRLHEEVRSVLQEVRQFGRDLRPSILDDLGLNPALEWLASEMEKENGIDTNLQVVGSERRFPAEAELMLFRIIQEALRNVARHSSASQARVTVTFNEQTTEVTVEDNGKGFALPQNLGDLSRLGKLGLTGMQERARLLGGSLKVESKLDKGTKVTVKVPF
ncbi:Oxygen sensor histidine kinase NreB [subsurface metagenome]